MPYFVANRELKAIDRGSNPPAVVVYEPGDVIPDFETWRESAKRSNLNMGYVRMVESLDEAKSIAEASAGKTAARKAKKLKLEGKKPELEKVAKPDEHGETFQCDLCGKGGMKSAKALKTHVTLAHTKKEA